MKVTARIALNALDTAAGERDHTLLEKIDLVGEGADYEAAKAAALAKLPAGALVMYITTDAHHRIG